MKEILAGVLIGLGIWLVLGLIAFVAIGIGVNASFGTLG